ncbi:Ku protein [Streptomyces lydicus]|uniref:Ku protein n=1 Tax=Streptomyces lydicus TaxID=47763 RepID=UPI0037A2E069
MRLLVQSTGRERLAVLRPRNGILVLHTLHWPEEIRDPGDLSSPAPTTDRELALGELLMTEMAGVETFFAFSEPFQPGCGTGPTRMSGCKD